jgi:hypothetical protein
MTQIPLAHVSVEDEDNDGVTANTASSHRNTGFDDDEVNQFVDPDDRDGEVTTCGYAPAH